MKWSLRVGRLLGIDVHIHLTFLLLLGFVGLAHWLTGRTVEAALTGVLFFVAIFVCVLLHEFGHALMARRYGIATRDITLLPIGGVARLERMPDKPMQELWVALAGPAVNVVIAALLLGWLAATNAWEPIDRLSTTQGSLVERLFAVNVFLVVFNLLPAFPMDGGRVLRAVLALRTDYGRATRIAATIGQGMAFLFGFVGLFTNPLLLFIALFVWIGASQEAAAAEMKSSLSGVSVGEAMLTDFKALAPDDRLGTAVRLLLAGSQQDFPVVDRESVVGLLPRARLLEALRERGEGTRVGDVMLPAEFCLEAGEDLDTALARVHAAHSPAVPVLRGGRIVGLLTLENIGELVTVRAALSVTGRLTPPPLPPRLAGGEVTL